MAEVALNFAIFVVTMGIGYTVRTAWLARRRKTQWRIYLIKVEPVWGGHYEIITRSLLVWETTLSPEEAMNHLPMIGTKWGDAIVESVGSD